MESKISFSLKSLGWNDFFQKHFEPFRGAQYSPARAAIQHRSEYILYSEYGELRGEITGKMRFYASGSTDLPAVGDWVVINARPEERAATIVELLPRKTVFSRKAPGPTSEEQIIASNVDIVFLVTGLDANFNLRRIERYLVVANKSGALPVIVLNKSDLVADLDEKIEMVRSIAGNVPIIPTSAAKGEGLRRLRSYLKKGTTGALLGSSGVGKSTMINNFLGEERFKTAAVREDDSRGRHTTTHRELVLLPGGGLLIDTPGLQELQLWDAEDGLVETFPEIVELTSRCRFRDCSHTVEPDCAVRKALEEGELDAKRYKSYQKLLREIAYAERKGNPAAERLEKERWKKITYDFKRGKLKGR